MSSIDEAREILARCLFVSPETINENDVIADIKPIDSLTFETLMLEVETKTGRDLEPVEIMGIETVADLANLMSERSPDRP